MKEKGRVIRTREDIAEVIVSRSPACSRCRACAVFDEGNVVAEAIDLIGVKVGDEVEIEIDDKSILKAASVVYLIPVSMLFGGYWLGSVVYGGREHISIITAFMFAIGSLAVIRLIDNLIYESTSAKPIWIRKRY